ncbi:MAG: glucosaminidase domain-containing protein [Halanaeroarchaeum sp.]
MLLEVDGHVGLDPGRFDVDTALTRAVAVTGEDIDAAIRAEVPDSPLIGLGDTFVAVQEEKNVDALYQAAHAIHESAWGKSTIAQDKNNLFGWGCRRRRPLRRRKALRQFRGLRLVRDG